MSIRNYSNTAAQSTLTASIGATDTSIVLAGYAGDPTPPFTAALARGTATEEIVLVTAVIGSTVTVVRGYDGTAAQAQAAGATFQEVVVALDFREANNHVNATGAVHGAGSQLVGVSDTQTLTNKTLTAPHVSDLTGTGSTTLAATNVTTLAVSGASSLTSLTVSGASTLASLSVTGAAALASATVAAAPVNPADVVRKDYADALGASPATVSSIMRRDGSGNTSVNEVFVSAAPSTAASATRKDYVDGKFSDGGWITPALSNSFTAGGLGVKYRVKNGICFYSFDFTRATAWTAGTIPFTFPAGARPVAISAYAHTVIQGAPVGSSTINPAGQILLPAGGAGTDVFLSGSFPVD